MICLFMVVEIFSRIFIDPVYFYNLNTYENKKNKSFTYFHSNNKLEDVGFIFIGSSRIPATINSSLFSELSNKITINAGHGYMTPGIHFQALKNKLHENPDYLKNTIVLIEYVGSDIYTSSFEDDKLKVYEPLVKTDKPMPHLLLPHLDFKTFISFLTESKNSIGVKIKMTSLMFATFRSFQYINYEFNLLNIPIFNTNTSSELVSEGGIRSDNLEFARQKAITIANQDKERIEHSSTLSFEIINESSFSKIHEIIIDNGGKLMVYEMPLHSIQKDVYCSEKSQENKVVFEAWLKEKGIPIIRNPDFHYTDFDFPDTWHLSKDRRDEFTRKLYYQIDRVLTQGDGSTKSARD